MAYLSAYDRVFDVPVVMPKQARRAQPRVARARAAIPVMADPRLMELEADIGRSPQFPRGWYIVPLLVAIVAIGVAIII